MTGFASMNNTRSYTGAKAADSCAAYFCGYNYARLITVSTAVAVLIFVARISALAGIIILPLICAILIDMFDKIG